MDKKLLRALWMVARAAKTEVGPCTAYFIGDEYMQVIRDAVSKELGMCYDSNTRMENRNESCSRS